jgi:hypothetical protein
MVNKNRIKLFFVVLLILVSCKKKPALEIEEKFEGNWKHYYGENWIETISIQNNSRGDIDRDQNGAISRSPKYKWLIKKNKLYHSWLTTKSYYVIDKYPSIADTVIIHNFDTIPVGRFYMILDGNYYVK